MNAVIYARYSSSSQREASIEDQLRICQEYAVANNLIVIKTYADYAVTGTNDDRVQFQSMIKQAAKKLFTTVLIYKNDRFARNRFDAAIYKKKLKDCGVKVVSVMEPIPDGPGGIVMESLYESMAEMYSANLAENIHRGQKGNAMKCLANCMPAFGYRIDQVSRKYVIDEATAPLLKHIFDMAAQGHTYPEILFYLTGQGYKRSNNWLYRTLQNRRYLGIYIYDDIEIPGGMPQLVDKKIFDDVQARRKAKSRHPRTKPVDYLLSLRLYCGKCGEMMTGEYGVGKGGTYRYYKCIGRKRKRGCDAHIIPAHYIENLVLKTIRDGILKDESIKEIAAATVKYQADMWKQESNCPALKAELADTEKRLRNLQNAIEQGVVTETTLSRLKELEDKRKKLLGMIASEQLKKPTLTEQDIIQFVKTYKEGDLNDPIYASKLIDTFATKVYIFDTFARIIFTMDKKAETSMDKEIIESSTNRNQWWR